MSFNKNKQREAVEQVGRQNKELYWKDNIWLLKQNIEILIDDMVWGS